MGQSVTIGGNRLGAGNKNKAYMHGYERSTHDLSYVWRSTIAPGTLVPFLTELALPGDTFDIGLNVDVLTHPTIGPLFGTYKIQLDVFQIPIRLYQGKLHMNMLNIGMDMSKVPIPQMRLTGSPVKTAETVDNQHINPSAIFSYLGVRGLGMNVANNADVKRDFNAIPYLGYWDIYKNYYANKQEEQGAMIHKDTTPTALVVASATWYEWPNDPSPVVLDPAGATTVPVEIRPDSSITMVVTGATPANFDPGQLEFEITIGGQPSVVLGTDLFALWTVLTGGQVIGEQCYDLTDTAFGIGAIQYVNTGGSTNDTEPKITYFDLTEIDKMRQNLLSHFLDTPYMIDGTKPAPYGLPFGGSSVDGWSKNYSQEGLALKTYNSDLFNNWISTEWIDGPDGISAVTAIDTSDGSFTIDELNLSKKIYNMLNRIAISGGTYDDWLDAVYDHDRVRSAENPMYLGGLIRNLVFQEVVSNSKSLGQPLGTLAGRGKMGDKNKGGMVTAKINEPSYLMGIISLTPNVDYSQGNKWDMNLKTLNDLHKPALDEIGFQDLITDQMAWWTTELSNAATPVATYKSAGKQPAWINYMTNVNKVYGNFADQSQQMFMVLNRRYEPNYNGADGPDILDLTTYIDPTKFNHIFADTRRDAQNFWAQIGVNMEVRRKMSAKVIPNL
ncbi:MAG: major capsid protein [Microviridae sp.]|nr:MAG: major capsid protein [Microviridae sp.]